MGIKFSKKSGGRSSGGSTQTIYISVNSRVSPDLSSYEAALELQSFHSTVQERTGRVIRVLVADADVRSLSFGSLRQVPLAETNEDAVKFILQRKEDIWNNPEFFDLVFDTGLRTWELGVALEESLKRARDSQLIIEIALQKFDDEQRLSVDGERSYANTLLELRKFKELGNPFTSEFFRKIQAAGEQQKLMLEKLQSKKRKFKSLKSWRKVSNVLFVSTFAAVLICSVVAAAVTAPPAVMAAAAGASMLLGPMGKGVNSIWRKYEKKVEREREIVRLMRIAIKDFDGIRALGDKLKTEIDSLLQNADSAVRGENEAVLLAVDEAKKKMSVFMQTIDELREHASKFSRDIRCRTTVVR